MPAAAIMARRPFFTSCGCLVWFCAFRAGTGSLRTSTNTDPQSGRKKGPPPNNHTRGRTYLELQLLEGGGVLAEVQRVEVVVPGLFFFGGGGRGGINVCVCVSAMWLTGRQSTDRIHSQSVNESAVGHPPAQTATTHKPPSPPSTTPQTRPPETQPNPI